MITALSHKEYNLERNKKSDNRITLFHSGTRNIILLLILNCLLLVVIWGHNGAQLQEAVVIVFLIIFYPIMLNHYCCKCTQLYNLPKYAENLSRANRLIVCNNPVYSRHMHHCVRKSCQLWYLFWSWICWCNKINNFQICLVNHMRSIVNEIYIAKFIFHRNGFERQTFKTETKEYKRKNCVHYKRVITKLSTVIDDKMLLQNFIFLYLFGK